MDLGLTPTKMSDYSGLESEHRRREIAKRMPRREIRERLLDSIKANYEALGRDPWLDDDEDWDVLRRR